MWKATRRHRQNVDCSDDFGRAMPATGSAGYVELECRRGNEIGSFLSAGPAGRASSARELPGAHQRGNGAEVPDRGGGRPLPSAADDPFAQP
jgi:hypothetical protein